MITFKQFRRRDGSMMLYINRDNGVSIGITADKGFSPWGKDATQGKRNAMDEAIAVMRAAPAFTGDLALHKETGLAAVTRLDGGWAICGTDTATIGGMAVSADGGYVIYDGRIAPCGKALSADDVG